MSVFVLVILWIWVVLSDFVVKVVWILGRCVSRVWVLVKVNLIDFFEMCLVVENLVIIEWWIVLWWNGVVDIFELWSVICLMSSLVVLVLS